MAESLLLQQPVTSGCRETYRKFPHSSVQNAVVQSRANGKRQRHVDRERIAKSHKLQETIDWSHLHRLQTIGDHAEQTQVIGG